MTGQVRVTITFENGRLDTQGNCSPQDMISLIEVAKFALLKAATEGTQALPAGATRPAGAIARTAIPFRPTPVA